MKQLWCVSLLLPALAAAQTSTVAVVPYQGLGAEPALVERLASDLRDQVKARGWKVLSDEETRTRQRAAAMCGEDVECLATLGQRLEAGFVVAFGLGRVGSGAMVTAMVVEVSGAVRRSDFEERLPDMPEATSALAQRAVGQLFATLKPPPRLVPKDVTPPAVVLAPAPRPLKPWAFGTAIGAGVLALGGAALTVAAQQHFAGLPDVVPAQRAAAESTQRTLNLAADATVVTAGVAAAAAVVLFLLDGPPAPQEATP